jgi:hypothetical protein
MRSFKLVQTEIDLSYDYVLEKLKAGYIIQQPRELEYALAQQKTSKSIDLETFGTVSGINLASIVDEDEDEDDDECFEVDVEVYLRLCGEPFLVTSRLLLVGDMCTYLYHTDNELAKKYAIRIEWANRPTEFLGFGV